MTTKTSKIVELPKYGSRELEARQANWLIESSSQMTLNEIRIVYYLMTEINATDPSKPKEFEVKIQEFAEKFKLKNIGGSLYQKMKEAAAMLWDRDVRKIDKDRTVSYFRLLQGMKYNDRQGQLTLEITDIFSTALYALTQQYTVIQVSNLIKLKSTYAFKLYELLWQYRNYGPNEKEMRKKREIKLKDLRFYFFCEDTYPRWADLSRRAVVPAIKEINEKTNLIVDFELIKTGKEVTSILFIYGLKTDFPDGKLVFKRTPAPKRPKLKRTKQLDTTGLDETTIILLEKYPRNFPFDKLNQLEREKLSIKIAEKRVEDFKASLINLRLLESWEYQMQELGYQIPYTDGLKIISYRKKMTALAGRISDVSKIAADTQNELERGYYGPIVKQFNLISVSGVDFVDQLHAPENETAAERRIREESIEAEPLEDFFPIQAQSSKGRGRPKKTNKPFSFTYDPHGVQDEVEKPPMIDADSLPF